MQETLQAADGHRFAAYRAAPAASRAARSS